ncbi:aldose 1-epimerase family protein [Tunicatimonas pelagia]|uniref:aldose 1-epimerase family protein n=1 Tax=Tunicatimonas pelagia TaxID=931531 RepID=UPI0026671853|nr:aldose 1-epimerase family protein [Tunicatimonas pelagia]WKN42221.1 aldose 1-epimerase family protein [Tunicatimonas pelagia]
MANYVLENDHLIATFTTEGAELTSVQSKASKQEYIWQADPAVWARHAPVLFPIVGRLKDDQYQWNNDTYSMSQHGFARDHNFSVIDQSNAEITFGLTASPETQKMYPFNFVFDIRYTLQENELTVAYRVANQGQDEMLFSIGAHPAFYCPTQRDQKLEEYHLQFEKPETLNRHLLQGGLRNGKTEPLLNNEDVLPLHRQLFESDAIIFKGIASSWVRIVRQSDGQPLVTVTFAGFPYLGVWQKVGSDFYCIEPWYGLADKKEGQVDFSEKEGVMKLSPEEQFTADYQIKFH